MRLPDAETACRHIFGDLMIAIGELHRVHSLQSPQQVSAEGRRQDHKGQYAGAEQDDPTDRFVAHLARLSSASTQRLGIRASDHSRRCAGDHCC